MLFFNFKDKANRVQNHPARLGVMPRCSASSLLACNAECSRDATKFIAAFFCKDTTKN